MPRRKRNKSSPANINKPKKYRFNPLTLDTENSDSEGSVYFDTANSSLSEGEETLVNTPTAPSLSTNMASLNEQDLVNLSAILAPKLAPLLVAELKSVLKAEVIAEVQAELDAKLRAEIEPLQAELHHLRQDNAIMRSEMLRHELEADELAQYSRRMCLDVSNIPGDEGSPTEDVEGKILKRCKEVGVEITSDDIDRCHRKGRFRPEYINQRRTIVKFTNSKARQRVYENRRKFGDGIFVQDNLTPLRESLSFQCRKLKRDSIISNTWVSGCRVFVLLKNETRGRVISFHEQINAIRNGKQIPEPPKAGLPM